MDHFLVDRLMKCSIEHSGPLWYIFYRLCPWQDKPLDHLDETRSHNCDTLLMKTDFADTAACSGYYCCCFVDADFADGISSGLMLDFYLVDSGLVDFAV